MRKLKLAGVLILLILFVVGCGGMSYKKIAYVAVENSKTFYEAAGPAVALLYKEGKISGADKDKVTEYGHQFAAKWEKADAALKAYKKESSIENKDKFQIALDVMQEIFKIFNEYYFSLTKKEVK